MQQLTEILLNIPSEGLPVRETQVEKTISERWGWLTVPVVTSPAIELFPEEPRRTSILIHNPSQQVLRVQFESAVNSNNFIYVASRTSLVFNPAFVEWRGKIYGVSNNTVAFPIIFVENWKPS